MNKEIDNTIQELWKTVDKLYAQYKLGANDFELGRLEYIRKNILKLQRKNKGDYENEE